MSQKAKKQIHITTGDSDGIGLEVTAKALQEIGPSRNTQFYVYAHPKNLKKLTQSNEIIYLDSTAPPVEWVISAAKICLSDPLNCALVTGPLSKTGIQQAGYPYIGHTEILKKISKSKNLFQVYLGQKANVLLVTDHISLSKVPKTLKNLELIEKALHQAHILKRRLNIKRPTALLALDPHAGEEGLIGDFDSRVLKEVIKGSCRKLSILGPIPADTAFVESSLSKFGLIVALYHDQGLIPFKTLHGFDEGVHLTAGLPFVRTSVDHGTAKDLFGKNKANPGSMKAAILKAVKLLEKT